MLQTKIVFTNLFIFFVLAIFWFCSTRYIVCTININIIIFMTSRIPRGKKNQMPFATLSIKLTLWLREVELSFVSENSYISLACNDLKKDYGLVRHIWVFNDIGAWPKCQKGPVTLVIVRTSWHFHLKLHHKVHFPKKLHLAVNDDNLKDSVTICIFISFSTKLFLKDNKSNCFLIALAITT